MEHTHPDGVRDPTERGEWEKWLPCPNCGSEWIGGIEHQGVRFGASEDGIPHSFSSDEPLGVVTAWCENCGTLLVEEGEIVVGDPRYAGISRKLNRGSWSKSSRMRRRIGRSRSVVRPLRPLPDLREPPRLAGLPSR